MRAVMASEAATSAKPSLQQVRHVNGPARKISGVSEGLSSVNPQRHPSRPWKAPAQSTSPSLGRAAPSSSTVSPIRPPPTTTRQPLPSITPPRSTGLGPVITPTRRASGAPSSQFGDSPRRPSFVIVYICVLIFYLHRHILRQSSKAWSAPAPMTPTPAASMRGMSFVAIQQLEIDQVDASSKEKDKRSLLEIQEEEEAKRQEDVFLKWWQAEEERMRLENEASTSRPQKPAQPSKSTGAGAKRRGGKPKKKAVPKVNEIFDSR